MTSPRRRHGPGRGLFALALAASIGCGTHDVVSPPGPVLLVGDSLFFQAAGELEEQLHTDSWNVEIVAHPGAGLGGGGYGDIDWSARLDETLAGSDPEIAVVELGTNGCGDACESVPGAIDEILDHLSDVPVVLWLTVRTEAPRPPGGERINQSLRDAAATHDNLTLLAYHQWLDGRPGLLRPDDVHLTPTGQQAVAAHVRDALRRHSDLTS